MWDLNANVYVRVKFNYLFLLRFAIPRYGSLRWDWAPMEALFCARSPGSRAAREAIRSPLLHMFSLAADDGCSRQYLIPVLIMPPVGCPLRGTPLTSVRSVPAQHSSGIIWKTRTAYTTWGSTSSTTTTIDMLNNLYSYSFTEDLHKLQ